MLLAFHQLESRIVGRGNAANFASAPENGGNIVTEQGRFHSCEYCPALGRNFQGCNDYAIVHVGEFTDLVFRGHAPVIVIRPKQ